MNLQNQDVTNTTAEPSPDQLTTAAASRRKFLVRASAASLPVIASVQSGSAWGCVDLTCKPGTQTLSTGGSAVASAVANKSSAYTKLNRPNWSSLQTIQKVIIDDFDGWLLGDYNNLTTYRYSPYTKYCKLDKNTLGLDKWYAQAAPGKVAKWNSSTKKWETYTRYRSTRTTGVRVPAVYPRLGGSLLLVTSATNLTDIFGSAMTGTLGSMAGHPYKYIIAAFVGALWERHPEYTFYFGERTLCYPAPKEIIERFQKATTQEKLGMNRLFEYYTAGTVDGKSVF